MESLAGNNTCMKNWKVQRERKPGKPFKRPFWIQVSVSAWILKDPADVKQSVGLFLKEDSTGCKQELDLSSVSHPVRTNAFGPDPGGSLEG